MSAAGVEIKSILQELKAINCCDRCILRFLNVKHPESYENPKAYIHSTLGEGNSNDSDGRPAKMVKYGPCSACLGLLQVEDYGTYQEKVVKEVVDANYDCDEINIALSLPIALILRNFSIWLCISQKFNDFYSNRRLYNDFDFSSDSMKSDGNVVALKEAWKILVTPKLAKEIGKTVNNGVDSKFHVTINFDYPDNGEETACMASMHPNIFANRGSQKRKYHNEIFTRKSVEAALEKTSRELFVKHYKIPPPIPSSSLFLSSICCLHDSIYIAGRYNKYSRSLSQTPWLIHGERRMDSSVEELISSPVKLAIPSDDIKFSSSGREDVDVRTLGIGRPFVLDVQNPHKTKISPKDFKLIQMKINSSTDAIYVRDLQLVPREDLVHIKAGETLKTKTYNSVCFVRGEEDATTLREKLSTLETLESFVIKQRTPVRVLHRRPLASRPRTVHWVRGQVGSTVGKNTFFTLKVKVEAGTYIKELVHGDLGRTVPNISSMLGVEADIVALDVEAVDLAWPPRIEDSEYNDNGKSIEVI